MARKKDSPQKAALRELMGNYLKENNVKVKDGTDVNSIMRDMMSISKSSNMSTGYQKSPLNITVRQSRQSGVARATCTD